MKLKTEREDIFMFAEKIELVLVKRKMTKAELATKLGMSTQNLYSRMKRDNFSENDMKKIAEVLECSLDVTMTLNDTNDTF